MRTMRKRQAAKETPEGMKRIVGDALSGGECKEKSTHMIKYTNSDSRPEILLLIPSSVMETGTLAVGE